MPKSYSETFVRAASVGITKYTVPPGKRAVVLSVACVNFAPAGSALAVVVAGLYVSYFAFPGSAQQRLETMRVTAYAGQQIEAHIAAAGMHTTVSGYLFDDTGAALADQVVDPEGEVLPPPAPADAGRPA